MQTGKMEKCNTSKNNFIDMKFLMELLTALAMSWVFQNNHWNKFNMATAALLKISDKLSDKLIYFPSIHQFPQN